MTPPPPCLKDVMKGKVNKLEAFLPPTTPPFLLKIIPQRTSDSNSFNYMK